MLRHEDLLKGGKGGGGFTDTQCLDTFFLSCSPKKKKEKPHRSHFFVRLVCLRDGFFNLLINTPYIPALKVSIPLPKAHPYQTKTIIPVIRPSPNGPSLYHPKIKNSHQPDQLLTPLAREKKNKETKKKQKKKNYAGKNLPINPIRMIVFPPPALPNHITHPGQTVFFFPTRGKGCPMENRNKLWKE